MIIIKKILLISLSVLLVIGSGVAIFTLYKKTKTQEEQIEILTQQIQAMSMEDLVNVVVAKYPIKAGTIVDENSLQFRQWDRGSLSPNMITDMAVLKDKLWKIDVSVEGPITADMVAKETYGPTDRVQLALVDAVTPSLQLGDYIDLRMVTPYGINYIVLPKKRVNAIYDSGIEIIMSEAEQMIYSGLLIDQYMNPGTMVYTSKYLEPTLQKSTYSMYVPPQEILDYMAINANMIYPYLSSDNVQGLRSYIESTQPWTLYGPSTFQTETQSIISKQEKITRSNNAISASMKSARNEFVQKQAELAAQNGQINTDTSNGAAQGGVSAPSGGGAGGGNYVDSEGVTRDSEGNPVLNPADLSTGVTSGTGTEQGAVTQPQHSEDTSLQSQDIE